MREVTALTQNQRPGLREPQDCVAYTTWFQDVTSGNAYVIRAILTTQHAPFRAVPESISLRRSCRTVQNRLVRHLLSCEP
jgi:NAD+--asparagine ADP-ribosyltransferase